METHLKLFSGGFTTKPTYWVQTHCLRNTDLGDPHYPQSYFQIYEAMQEWIEF